MNNKSAYLLTLLFCLSAYSQTQDTLISIPWGSQFHYKTNEAGEILTISGVCFRDSTIYLYNMADRTLLLFNTLSSMKHTVHLESVGRNTYVGDDFVIVGQKAVFLNTVDRRLELFDLESGAHVKSLEYPYNYFSSKLKRRLRIINKIYMENNTILLGNSHSLFYFDITSGEVLTDKKRIAPPKGGKILFYNGNDTLVQCGNIIKRNNYAYSIEKEIIPVSGKQYFMFQNRPYRLKIDFTGMSISKKKKVPTATLR